MKEKKINQTAGITLVALTITIIVILILAGITISTAIGEGGFIGKAEQSQITEIIEKYRAQIDGVHVKWATDKILNDDITVDHFWIMLEDRDIIADRTKDVEKLDEEGIYQITTVDGYVFELYIDESKTELTYIGKNDKLLPVIRAITVTGKSTSTIDIQVKGSRLDSGSLSYYYKKTSEESYLELKTNTTDITANYTGLEHNTSYDIKVVATNKNGSNESIIQVTTRKIGEATEGLQEGVIIASTPTWNNGTARITLSTTTDLSIQWQKNGISGTWTTGTEVTGINHNETIFARLTDGNNYGDEASVLIIDGTAPSVIVTQGAITTKSIAVSVSSSDAQTGMVASPSYSYYIKKTSDSNYPTTASYTGTNTSYTFNNLAQTTSYDIKVTTQDIAGNIGTGIITNVTTGTVGGATSGLKTGNIVASNPTWSNGTASITLSTTTGLTIQWQKGGISGNWTTGTQVTGINHNVTVFARLTDGKNYGNEASVTVLDGNNPQTATISLGATTANTGVNVTATVTHNDNESGPNIANCKWVYNTTSGTIGTNPSSYTGTFSSNGQSINLNASLPGSYYLHVLTVDKAGRATESIKGPITVKQLVTGISLSPTSATIETGKTQTLTVTITPSNASNKNVTWKSSNTGVATVSNGVVTGVTPGTATITATAADGSGQSATCSITVKAALAADGNFNSTKGINTPKLGTGMTAIKWNGSTWVNTTGDDPEWYDYSNKKWANATTSDGSMWVWIPRYAYQITTNYSNGGSGVSGNINIKFMKGTTNEAADGTTSWNNSSGSGNWNIHPAFTYGSTVPGIWVAKFEASHSDATASAVGSSATLKVAPGVMSWRSITISNIYSTCLNYNTTLNSHQMKNSEWGAVAYLAQSTYGKNSEVWINPNSKYITGQAGTGPSVSSTTSTYAYTDTTYGVNASTTGNVTGIYDMSGGAWEYVAAYVNNGNGNLSSYGSNLVNGAAKTKDVYSTSSDSQSNNYNAAASVYGDAVYETSSSYSESNSWYSDYSRFPYSNYPFFFRGGYYYSATGAGLFCFYGLNGDGGSNYGFRPVLVVL